MKHRVKGRKLGRTASHRLATLRSLATALFRHKKIKTTLAKAKQARIFIEPLITKAKDDSVHSRRYVARHIHDKAVVQELFSDIMPKIGDRPGGYLRLVKLGQRRGDAADMAVLELVDFTDSSVESKPTKVEENVEEANVVEETTEVAEAPVEEVVEEKVEEKVVEDSVEEVAEETVEEEVKKEAPAEKAAAKKVEESSTEEEPEKGEK